MVRLPDARTRTMTAERIEYRGTTIIESAPTDEEIRQRLDSPSDGEKMPPQKLPASVRQAYRAAKQASRERDRATRAYVAALRSGQPVPAAAKPKQRTGRRGAEQRTLFEF